LLAITFKQSNMPSELDFYRRVMNRVNSKFVEKMDPMPLLDRFIDKEFLPNVQIRDIQVSFLFLFYSNA